MVSSACAEAKIQTHQADEDSFIVSLKAFFDQFDGTSILTGALVKPEFMPVKVVDITNQDEIKRLYTKFIETFGENITSRYPDREDENYYPHITAEYNNQSVIPVDDYLNKRFDLNNIWLLKDIGSENSLAYTKIK